MFAKTLSKHTTSFISLFLLTFTFSDLSIFTSLTRLIHLFHVGCFNGTEYDDIMDESLHIKKYSIWSEGEYDMRCGDVGIHIYRSFHFLTKLNQSKAWNRVTKSGHCFHEQSLNKNANIPFPAQLQKSQ